MGMFDHIVIKDWSRLPEPVPWWLKETCERDGGFQTKCVGDGWSNVTFVIEDDQLYCDHYKLKEGAKYGREFDWREPWPHDGTINFYHLPSLGIYHEYGPMREHRGRLCPWYEVQVLCMEGRVLKWTLIASRAMYCEVDDG